MICSIALYIQTTIEFFRVVHAMDGIIIVFATVRSRKNINTKKITVTNIEEYYFLIRKLFITFIGGLRNIIHSTSLMSLSQDCMGLSQYQAARKNQSLIILT